MEEPVEACSLSEQQLEKRRAELRAGLLRRIRRVRTLDDGISFAFDRSPENARDLAAFIEFESGCCGFARMSLRDDSSTDASWLEIRGPEGTVEIFGQMVPVGMAVEPAEMRRGLLRLGLSGMGASLFAGICCATPVLGIGIAALGLGSAAGAAVAFWVDATAIPLLAVSVSMAALHACRLRSAA